MMRITNRQLLPLVLLSATCSQAEDDRWTVLFDGTTLQEWTVVNGDIPFEVRNAEIVGKTVVDVPTRYLTTKRQFGDFILELEVNNSEGENTGIQFRSVTDAPFYSGLTGYQMEIDPSSRGWTGGIYFEGVGEWAHAPINNSECHSAWQEDAWNTLRIEAKGERMRTFVNETPCAYLFGEYLQTGHIGLQIHSIGADPEKAGAATRWRNIKILENPLGEDYTEDDFAADSQSRLIDRLSPLEKASGWQLARSLLADDADGWRRATLTNPINLQTQAATVLELAADGPVALAHIPIKTDDYQLVADMQFEPGTEGEIIYSIPGEDRHNQPVNCSGSYRLFDDRSLDGRSADDPQLIGSLTGKLPAANLSEPGRDKRVLYGDAWRRVGLKVQAGRVEHWLNSVKIVEFDGCEVADVQSLREPGIAIRIQKGKAIFRTIKVLPGGE